MSGGSYNYLTHAYDLEDILAKRIDLREMAERLEGLSELEFPGATAAAASTRDLLLRLEMWETHARTHIALLKDVWHDVEWWDSGDYGPDQVKAGLSKLLGE
jgi:hypothetical protein